MMGVPQHLAKVCASILVVELSRVWCPSLGAVYAGLLVRQMGLCTFQIQALCLYSMLAVHFCVSLECAAAVEPKHACCRNPRRQLASASRCFTAFRLHCAWSCGVLASVLYCFWLYIHGVVTTIHCTEVEAVCG
jgi:hypothetical protein